MGKWTWPGEGTEILPAAEVGRRIHLRRLAEVGVSALGKGGLRPGGVATVAVDER